MNTPSGPISNNAVSRKPAPLVPPEEQFWQHYSPHHEFPLSSVISVAFYALMAVGLYVAIHYLAHWFNPAHEPLPVEAIALAAGGGSGGTGGDGGEAPKEDLPQTQDTLPKELQPKVRLTDLPRPDVKPEIAQEFDPKDADVQRYIEQKNLAVSAFGDLQKNARDQMLKGLGNPGGNGNGNGNGAGNGNGDGPGGRILTDRQKRVLRWTMTFDTVSGDDYRRQLSALGAILGVPGPESYLIIRDLNRKPAVGKVEDLNQIKRIFWIDNRPDSVGPLAAALGLKPVPEHVVAFFPEKMESDLVRKERAFRSLTEEQIQETRFRVVKRGSTYEPVVVDQTAKR
jgi:hypothetical protein